MKAFTLSEQMRIAMQRRCTCAPCDFKVLVAWPVGHPESPEAVYRDCGQIHHDQRGRYHERLFPHSEHSNRRQRREGLARAALDQTAPRVQEERDGDTAT